jgi:flagellar hook-length control protein FliK
VQEAQSAQDAMLDPQAEAPVEDMRFWLQGKHQRAEVVLEKDGQPVRVQVSVRGNEAHVTFRADQAQTRELLDASLTQLREMLEQQGVQLAGVSVQADGQGQGGNGSPQQGSRNPWEASPVQQAQVVVPVVPELPTARSQRAQGLDLYA